MAILLQPLNLSLFSAFLFLLGNTEAFSVHGKQNHYKASALASSAHDVVETTSTAFTTPTTISSRRSFLNNAVTAAAAFTTSFLVLSAPTLASAAAPLPPTGKAAPDFELENSRGDGKVSLKTLKDTGKWTVLYFYPGAFTSGCTLEARGFQKDMAKYKKLNAQIVGVSVDPPEKNAQFCSSEGLDFYMLSDVGGAVSKSYGSALSVPGFGTFSNRQTYIIDPNGDLAWVFTDVESRVARHSAEVIEKLSELTGQTVA